VAKSDGSVDSWPGLLGELNKNFLLLRDVFGYAMPGGVFFAVGLVSGRISLCQLKCLLWPYDPPMWVVFLLGVVACYVVGNILAGTAYMPFSVAKYIVWMVNRHWFPWPVTKPPTDPPEGSWRDWLINNPTEVSAKVLVIPLRNPGLLDTLERRETLVILGGSTAVAFFGGWLFFYAWPISASCIFLIASAILSLQFLTGLSHVRRVAKETVAADLLATPPAPDPNFAKLLASLIDAATAYLKK
jgi:hypothetical protein